MKVAASDRAASIFFALSQVPHAERLRLLDERCDGDADLRAEVDRLLRGLELPDSVLTPPLAADAVQEAGPSLRPGAVVGDFAVIRQIGAGGTGVVYLAHQQYPPRVVALKVLRREFVASAVQRRFEIEAELLAHLHHPGIAQIYAAHPGDATAPPFIAMELVNGPPLTEHADDQRLSVRDRVELFTRVCDAVQHAHHRGVIHRDLKPGNILVGEDGQPKVLDFGVARRSGVEVSAATIATETGQLVGTLAYMSPEQVQAHPEAIDTRTDIHALGVILFRLLAGRLPFGHDDPPLPELARRIVQDEPPRLGTVDPALRGDLEIIVARALAKEKERRYASAAALAADLRRYLAGQPISASADSAWYVLRRQIGRYRLALALSAAAVVALASLAFYASVQRGRAARMNVELQHQLATSTIERGRLMSQNGNHPLAEELVWREFFRQPDSRHAQWTLWEMYSREPSLWTHIEHEGGTQIVRFSPDGRSLLTAGRQDGSMHLVDVDSGRVVRIFTTEPRSGTRRAFFTADGTSIVSGTDDGSLRVWDAATGALRREFRYAIPRLQDFAVTPDGLYAAAVADGRVELWSLVSGERVADFSGLAAQAFSIATGPTNAIVVAGSDDGSVTAIDRERRTRLWQVRGHTSQVISAGVSPDGRVVVSGSVDGLINMWDAATGHLLRAIASGNGRVRSLAFDAAGTRLVAAGLWRTRMWNLERPAEPPRDLGASEGTTDAHIRGDGQFVATCTGGSGRVRLWHVAADARSDAWSGHESLVVGLNLGDGGRSIVSAGNEGVVSIWRPGQRDPHIVIPSAGKVSGLDVSADGRWLVSVGAPGAAAVWDARDGRRLAELAANESRAVTFAGSGRRIVVGESNGTLKMWDWVEGSARYLREVPSTDTEVLALISYGGRIFAAHRNHAVVEREAETGREIRRFESASSPFSLALTPDGRMLAAGTWLGDIELWDLGTGRRIAGFRGQGALVNGVDFSPDGTLLALASRDGSTRLWDVAAFQELATIAVRSVGAERVRFFPDGQRLAIGYEDGQIEIRDLKYFFRYAAGQAEYEMRLLREAGESFPRAAEALAWSRRMLSR